MIRSIRLPAMALAVVCMVAVAAPAYSKGKVHKRHNHSGQKLLGNKIHTNGSHVMEKVGKNTVSVEVKNGKVAGMKVKHSQKGNLAVTKYKTKSTQTLGQAGGNVMRFASNDPTLLAQDEGWTWIGYSYIDDYGYEEIYWFPYEMIYDGDTGAILYVPADEGY